MNANFQFDIIMMISYIACVEAKDQKDVKLPRTIYRRLWSFEVLKAAGLALWLLNISCL